MHGAGQSGRSNEDGGDRPPCARQGARTARSVGRRRRTDRDASGNVASPNRRRPPARSGPIIAPERPAEPRIVNDAWIADRMRQIEASGIRKAFDMAKAMKDPINLSIGLPDFDVAEPVKAAAIDAIERGPQRLHRHPGHPRAAGQAPGRRRRRVRPRRPPGHRSPRAPRAACCWRSARVVNPGDEVIVFDPYFVMYNNLVALAGGTSGPGRHLPRLPHRRRQGRRRDHAAGPSASSSTARPTRRASSPRPRR